MKGQLKETSLPTVKMSAHGLNSSLMGFVVALPLSSDIYCGTELCIILDIRSSFFSKHPKLDARAFLDSSPQYCGLHQIELTYVTSSSRQLFLECLSLRVLTYPPLIRSTHLWRL